MPSSNNLCLNMHPSTYGRQDDKLLEQLSEKLDEMMLELRVKWFVEIFTDFYKAIGML